MESLGARVEDKRMRLECPIPFQGSHEFKIASMTKTLSFPADPWFQLGDLRLVLVLAFRRDRSADRTARTPELIRGPPAGLREEPLRAAGLRQDLPQRRVVAHGLELLA